jgi:DNA ligase-1
MSPNKTGAAWTYMVFDIWNHSGTNAERRAALEGMAATLAGYGVNIRVVPTWEVADLAELELIEAECLKQGLEGVIARKPEARYKFGRSSPKNGPLWKIKRFIDFEAEVIGVYEKMHNDNVAMTNALGRTERSTAKAGLRPAGTLGGFKLRAINGPAEGIEFRCGTGFDDEQRRDLWRAYMDCAVRQTNTPIGRVAKIKSFPIGVKDKPRFPVFLGFRDMEIDG